MKVSVLVTTFEHERFIAEALGSVLAQEVDPGVEVEILVGDDASGDGTRRVIEEVSDAHPGRITTYFPPRNLGGDGKAIFADLVERADGDVIAMMDGDDAWTSPRKLQTQLDFLAGAPEYAMCFHNVHMVNEAAPERSRPYNSWTEPRDVGLGDALATCVAASCSPVFRAGVLRPLPAWYFDLPWGDWPLYLMAVTAGRVRYLPDVLGTYRIHPRGMYSKLSTVEARRLRVAFYERLPPFPGHEQQVAELLAEAWLSLAAALAADGRRGEARDAVRRSFGVRPVRFRRRSGERDRLRALLSTLPPLPLRWLASSSPYDERAGRPAR